MERESRLVSLTVMIRFLCPTCGHSLRASSKKAGSVSSCPSCNQMVQVPAAVPSSKSATAPVVRSRREGMGPFWALLRLSLWGLCFLVVVLSVVYYFTEIEKKVDSLEKALVSVQALIYILGSYYLARTFEDSTKSLEELMIRLRRRKK